MFSSGASSKYRCIFCASIVADMTMTLRSGRRLVVSLTSPNNTSVANVLSWASSNMITLYFASSGSKMASRRSKPSVMNESTVSADVLLSKRITYPTSEPRLTSSSSATRWATLIVATRLGWVHAMVRDCPLRK